MPNVQWNKFIDDHNDRYCVAVHFQDYAQLKKRVKGTITTTEGKVYPTPNELVRAVAKRLKQDYAIKSENASQLIMFADKAEAAAFAKAFGAKEWQKGNGKPCTASTLCVVDGESQTRLAKHLKLL